GELLVHGDGFHGEALSGVGVANALEALNRLIVLAKASVKIADGVADRQIFGICFEDFLVLSNRVLKLALLDKLLRRAEHLLLVEPKTKRHMSADSGQVPPKNAPSWECSLTAHHPTAIRPNSGWPSGHGHCKAGYPELYGY